jgi:hypothetical protein
MLTYKGEWGREFDDDDDDDDDDELFHDDNFDPPHPSLY